MNIEPLHLLCNWLIHSLSLSPPPHPSLPPPTFSKISVVLSVRDSKSHSMSHCLYIGNNRLHFSVNSNLICTRHYFVISVPWQIVFGRQEGLVEETFSKYNDTHLLVGAFWTFQTLFHPFLVHSHFTPQSISLSPSFPLSSPSLSHQGNISLKADNSITSQATIYSVI